MRFGQPWVRICALAALAVALPLLGGCAGGEPATAEERVAALEVEEPLRSPVWARNAGALLALVEDEPRVAKVEPDLEASEAATTLSGRLEGVGENLATSADETERAYLPQPGIDRVAVIDLEGVRMAGSFEAGSSPSQVAVGVGSEILFALSGDGSTVTGVDLETREALLPPVEEVEAGQVAAPQRGLASMFWAVGPESLALYEGHPTPLEEVDSIQIQAGSLAIDTVKVSRAYVAEEGTNRLLAVGLSPIDEELTVAAEMELEAPVRYVGVDERRVYAATREELVVLETDNFDGFDDRSFTVVDTIEFRDALEREALRDAPLSGLAVDSASERVYLTLEGEPYVLSVEKPDY